MDEEKGLVSPISGGVRAVRRNISSNMFVSRRQNEPQKPDPVTTNLLTTQSLQLRNVSRQLELISNAMVGINSSLNGVKESLALSQQLENQREQAKRNRDRQLAEQGLREGKESALEKKIQFALQSPLKRVAAKAQGVLFSFQKFFLFLAGGWLTNVGIDLINALVTGNTELINKLKLKFTVGLLAIGATFTAFNVGFKLIFNSLRTFVSIITRLTFGGIIKTTLAGFRLLLKNVALRAGLFRAAPSGFFGGSGGGAAAAVGTSAIVAGGVETDIKKTLNKLADDIGKGKRFTPNRKINKIFNRDATRFTNKIGFTNVDIPKLGERIKIDKKFSFKAPSIPNKILGGKTNVNANIFKKIPGSGFLTKGNQVVQILFAMQRFNERSQTQGEVQAITGTVAETFGGLKGFTVGSSLFATKMIWLNGVAPPLGSGLYALGTFVSGLAGAMLGSEASGFLNDKIFSILNKGKKDVDVDNENKPDTLSFKDDTTIIPVSSLSEEKQKELGIFEPIKKVVGSLEEEESNSITMIPDNNQMSANNNIATQKKDSSRALPGISFNNGNPHTMYSVMQMGVA